MSSTNRSAAREKHISDYYITPLHTIKEFTDAASLDWSVDVIEFDFFDTPFTILDPCAVGDPQNAMAYPSALQHHTRWNISHIETVDVREDSLASIKADYLTHDFGQRKFDMVITNPPFNIALEVIRKALRDVRPGGLVIMLLRLNYFGTFERQLFFQKTMPLLTYVHTKRPKFKATSSTDSCEYMHAVWQQGNYPRFTRLRII